MVVGNVHFRDDDSLRQSLRVVQNCGKLLVECCYGLL